MGIVSTTKPIPTSHNGLFTTNRGELEYPSLWDGLELAYFPHNDGGGAILKGYGDLATNATIVGTPATHYSWIDSEIGKMWHPDGANGYATTNNTSFVNKIDNDFSHMMWTQSGSALTNSDRWWGMEDAGGPRLYALVKGAGSTAVRFQIVAFDDLEYGEKWYTTDDNVDTGTHPMAFICSMDWSAESGNISAFGAKQPITSGAAAGSAGDPIGAVAESNEPIFIGARNVAGTPTKFTRGSVGFSTIAWWSRQLSQEEHRILGNDPFVLCRRVED